MVNLQYVFRGVYMLDSVKIRMLTVEWAPNEAPKLLLSRVTIAMEDPVLRALPDSILRDLAIKIQVLARSTTADNSVLVKTFEERGKVTSVTGSKMNGELINSYCCFCLRLYPVCDCLRLLTFLSKWNVFVLHNRSSRTWRSRWGIRPWDCGIGDCERGVPYCDLYDNIQSMTRTALCGRNICEPIQKFLQFQLVVNVVAVTLPFMSACTRNHWLSELHLFCVEHDDSLNGSTCIRDRAAKTRLAEAVTI